MRHLLPVNWLIAKLKYEIVRTKLVPANALIAKVILSCFFSKVMGWHVLVMSIFRLITGCLSTSPSPHICAVHWHNIQVSMLHANNCNHFNTCTTLRHMYMYFLFNRETEICTHTQIGTLSLTQWNHKGKFSLFTLSCFLLFHERIPGIQNN